MVAGGNIAKHGRGPGRPPGTPNKVPAAVKDMILQALNEAHEEGGAAYLKVQAVENPNAFLALVGKVLPLDVNNKHSGTTRVIHVPVPKTKLDE